MPKGDKFEKGDLVFAKVKGYPAWPARITGLSSKERYKIYFYGTYETATLKSEEIWLYSDETRKKFGPKYMKKRGYREGLYQIENTPEIAGLEGEERMVPEGEDLNSSVDSSALVVDESLSETPTLKKIRNLFDTPQPDSVPLPEKTTNKRKAEEEGEEGEGGGAEQPASDQPANKKPHLDEMTGGGDSGGGSNGGGTPVEKLSRRGRPLKPKRFDDGEEGDGGRSPARVRPASASGEQQRTPAVGGGEGPVKSGTMEAEKPGTVAQKDVLQQSEGRRLWVKVKDTDDLIEINLDKDRPNMFESEEARQDWEMASARKALKFKKRVENGEFVPPEILKKLEEAARLSPEEREAAQRKRRLERSKNKLRWLRIEQRLVELDIAVKTSLNLERPSPDRCISALDELEALYLAPLMLKKQPDIVTTIKKLRKYIGPMSYKNWPDEEARYKMDRSIRTIQGKAGKIYQKFKDCFTYSNEEDVPFYESFLKDVTEFREATKNWEERKVLSLIKDPTRPISRLNPLSDDDDM